ncbi:AAA family ATPase [Streptomyces sp. NPDC088745]|uniref:AAA family ATPase n=1 Tax=Streptomyces sp. NPDC088745 TaxID=3365884 RepID=UPI0038176494
MNSVGSADTRLIVLRGNSASGKSSVAAEIRRRYGRGLAIVGQDNLRREVLREHDVPGGANIGLIDVVARYALEHGFHVVVEGILYADRYGAMLEALRRDHRGTTRMYYFDVPYEETLRRHGTKPQVTEYGDVRLREWYRGLDVLPGAIEEVVPASSSLAQTVGRVMAEAFGAG